VLVRYTSGEQAGRPAVTRRAPGPGSAAYVSTRLGPAGLTPLLARLAASAGVTSELPPALRGRVELAVRGPHRFLINRTDHPQDVSPVAGPGRILAPRAVMITTQGGTS
jgi:beta-galactosidase